MASTSERYKDNLLALCDVTKEIIVHIQKQGIKTRLQPSIIDFGSSIIESSSPESIIDGFIKRSHEYCVKYKIEDGSDPHPYVWEKIRNKEEDFLLNNLNTLFGELSKDTVILFAELFSITDSKGKLAVSSEKKEDMWSLLHGMVRICINYIHEKRKPGEIEKEINGEIIKTKGYTVTFYSDIKVKALTEKWNMNV